MSDVIKDLDTMLDDPLFTGRGRSIIQGAIDRIANLERENAELRNGCQATAGTKPKVTANACIIGDITTVSGDFEDLIHLDQDDIEHHRNSMLVTFGSVEDIQAVIADPQRLRLTILESEVAG